jgi:hypothetical protein
VLYGKGNKCLGKIPESGEVKAGASLNAKSMEIERRKNLKKEL